MTKSNKGVSGVSREAVAHRDLDRLIWADKQQQRRDRRNMRSGTWGYGLLARQDWEEELES